MSIDILTLGNGYGYGELGGDYLVGNGICIKTAYFWGHIWGGGQAEQGTPEVWGRGQAEQGTPEV